MRDHVPKNNVESDLGRQPSIDSWLTLYSHMYMWPGKHRERGGGTERETERQKEER